MNTLPVLTPAPSILKEDMPTRPPLNVDLVIAPSIIKEGIATRKPLSTLALPLPQ